MVNLTEDLERKSFNNAIARLYSFVGALNKNEITKNANHQAAKEALEFLLIMLGPFVPHLAEEGWRYIEGDGLLCEQKWPDHINNFVVEDKIKIAIQINGKRRDEMLIAKDAETAEHRVAVQIIDWLQLEANIPYNVKKMEHIWCFSRTILTMLIYSGNKHWDGFD